MQPGIPWAKPEFWGNEQKYVNEALASTWISGGAFVGRLEREFAEAFQVPFALTCSNGTTALHMIYLGLGIGPGDEVIVPGFAFMAAANVTLHLGAAPVFAEVDPATWCLTAEAVEEKITPRTKAIVPIHTYGNMCLMRPILALAESRGIAVIEDVAEALSSRYQGRFAGTIARIGAFSLQATKVITTGEGGMVVTEDEDLFRRMQLFRSHGMSARRYWHEAVGHNFRLTNLQAAIGCAQLEKLGKIIAERKRMHDVYRENLAHVPGITLQLFPADVEPVLWAMAVKLDPRAFPQGRDRVMQQMADGGIETRPGFYAASLMDLYSCGPLPVCEEISRQVISLPSFPSLRNEQIEMICQALLKLRR